MIDTAYFLAIFLIFLRLTTFFFVVKVFYPKGTPNILKGAIGIILSLAVAARVDYKVVLEISNNYALALAIISEVMSGLILGYIINAIFDVIKMAGAFMDNQLGLTMMNMLNPSDNTNNTLLANFSYYIGAVIFFIVDGHHVLIRCIMSSFDVVKIGQSILFQDTFYTVLDAFIKYFIIGVRIALPIIIIGLITDLCMSLVSRTVPAINVMVLGMPVRLVVGLLTFVVFLPIMIKIFVSTFGTIPDVLSKVLKSMAAMPLVMLVASDDKTEEATPKKKSEARKKGQIAKSKDVGLAMTMLACTMVIMLFSGMIVVNLRNYMQHTLQAGILESLDMVSIKYIFMNLIVESLKAIFPVAIPIMIAGVAGSIMQTGFMLTGEPLKPKLSKLNPLSGLKNMFSKKSLADLIKNLIVVSIVGFISYKYVVNNYYSILQMSSSYLPSLGKDILNLFSGIFVQISIVLIIIAAADFFVQLRFYNKDMRMTKQEIKEEYKQMEGDPQLKSKIKQKQREMATKRMMSSVPDATVVITNPTHLAIAIKYEDGSMEAPKVVAKGAELVALKIKEIAKENNVPIMENKPLARMIYEQVEIDQEIPHDMYQAVAEVLALVFKLKK
ncbi:fused FliR family export protein/FlhB family type III secretion system protein [Clostridium sp. SHJSY1]|uniref:fused FliR family export protein/FlhB family type III secretion system protein n=1 Tax=Clostridium sp. SHJSY1 TaxID=2942483 RepID=UPI0028765BFE|nr:fused FliR family export protein/FlhB family type III secretion system protein [Clostridium sp. SHJSY1]MDS0524095.1 fused FliR family export protein/FlhB family type III secretion system protein [Clostridium sp. SHJSY1]